MAVVSVPGDEADGPTSTGEGAAGTTRTRTTENDEGAASEQENSSSRLISVEASFDIVGGQPWTGTAELSRANGSSAGAMGSSETNSEPIDGTVAAASGGQVADSLGRIRTPVVWGQGIPLRPARTIQQIGPKRKHQAVQTTNQVSGVQTSIMSNILPSHASVTDAVTRLQRERDLALRRIDELHAHHKKEIEKRDESDRKSTLISMEVRNDLVREAQKETAHYKSQFEHAMELVENQKLSIKMLQDELGEEAEFDAEETAQMRSVRRECEARVNRYEDRLAEICRRR
jgi:hypothetical protein